MAGFYKEAPEKFENKSYVEVASLTGDASSVMKNIPLEYEALVNDIFKIFAKLQKNDLANIRSRATQLVNVLYSTHEQLLTSLVSDKSDTLEKVKEALLEKISDLEVVKSSVEKDKIQNEILNLLKRLINKAYKKKQKESPSVKINKEKLELIDSDETIKNFEKQLSGISSETKSTLNKHSKSNRQINRTLTKQQFTFRFLMSKKLKANRILESSKKVASGQRLLKGVLSKNSFTRSLTDQVNKIKKSETYKTAHAAVRKLRGKMDMIIATIDKFMKVNKVLGAAGKIVKMIVAPVVLLGSITLLAAAGLMKAAFKFAMFVGKTLLKGLKMGFKMLWNGLKFIGNKLQGIFGQALNRFTDTVKWIALGPGMFLLGFFTPYLIDCAKKFIESKGGFFKTLGFLKDKVLGIFDKYFSKFKTWFSEKYTKFKATHPWIDKFILTPIEETINFFKPTIQCIKDLIEFIGSFSKSVFKSTSNVFKGFVSNKEYNDALEDRVKYLEAEEQKENPNRKYSDIEKKAMSLRINVFTTIWKLLKFIAPNSETTMNFEKYNSDYILTRFAFHTNLKKFILDWYEHSPLAQAVNEIKGIIMPYIRFIKKMIVMYSTFMKSEMLKSIWYMARGAGYSDYLMMAGMIIGYAQARDVMESTSEDRKSITISDQYKFLFGKDIRSDEVNKALETNKVSLANSIKDNEARSLFFYNFSELQNSIIKNTNNQDNIANQIDNWIRKDGGKKSKTRHLSSSFIAAAGQIYLGDCTFNLFSPARIRQIYGYESFEDQYNAIKPAMTHIASINTFLHNLLEDGSLEVLQHYFGIIDNLKSNPKLLYMDTNEGISTIDSLSHLSQDHAFSPSQFTAEIQEMLSHDATGYKSDPNNPYQGLTDATGAAYRNKNRLVKAVASGTSFAGIKARSVFAAQLTTEFESSNDYENYSKIRNLVDRKIINPDGTLNISNLINATGDDFVFLKQLGYAQLTPEVIKAIRTGNAEKLTRALKINDLFSDANIASMLYNADKDRDGVINQNEMEDIVNGFMAEFIHNADVSEGDAELYTQLLNNKILYYIRHNAAGFNYKTQVKESTELFNPIYKRLSSEIIKATRKKIDEANAEIEKGQKEFVG